MTRDIEEALLQAVLAGADEAISPLILYGARRWVLAYALIGDRAINNTIGKGEERETERVCVCAYCAAMCV